MNNHELFTYKSHQFRIIRPSEFVDYFVVLSDSDEEYEWIDKLNKYCIMNNIGYEKLDKLKKKIIKYCEEKGAKVLSPHIDSDIEYYTLKSKLQNLVPSSISPLAADKSSKSLFNKETVANIIINEYLECSKYLMNERNINLSLSNANIYIWNLHMSQFKNDKLNCDLKKISKKTRGIEIEISFHGEFYPNYPPVIKIIKPYLKNSLVYRISNSKMTQLDYWTPTRSIKYIIDRTIQILEKYGEIDVDYTLDKTSNSNIIELETNLIKLASFTDSVIEDDEIDSDETFIRFGGSTNSNNTSSKASKEKYWKRGTGYGHSGASSWNIDEYVKSQKDKDEKLRNVIQNIINIIQMINHTPSEFNIAIEMIKKSLLIPYLKQQFKYATLLEIQQKEDLFKQYLSLFETLCTEESIQLFNGNNDSLFSILENRNKEFKQSLTIDKDNNLALYFVNLFEGIIFPFYEGHKALIEGDKNIVNVSDNDQIVNIEENDVKVQYKSKMIDFRFSTENILNTNYKDEYKKNFVSEKGNNWKTCQKRLATELTSLMGIGQLPIEYDSSVFICIDEDNPMIIRALITGPVDTPYDSGCLIFDIYTGSNYPNQAPSTWFMNHGGNRFNPNLYGCGKVCLSILGTWSGTQSESWNSKTSTLLQILISIQAQILIEEPYFNEPGHERGMGSSTGVKASKQYNDNIRLYMMKSAVRDLINNPKLYPQFENAIKEHFKLKKEHMIETYKKWCNEAPSNLRGQYDEVFKDIQKGLDKL